MPLIVQLVTSDPATTPGADLIYANPEDATFYSCPVIMKTRTAIVNRGELRTVRWELRNRAGQAVDISTIIADSGSGPGEVKVRFGDAFGCTQGHIEVACAVVSAEAGLIDVPLTAELVAEATIWNMELGVHRPDGSLVFTDKGFLSVERGMFGSGSQQLEEGPITIGELRIALRDTWVENDLTGNVEYSEAEVIQAILEPVKYFNERPPDIGTYCAKYFPFHYHWKRGAIGYLLKIAAAWYARTNVNSTAGGVALNDRDRVQPYMALAKEYWQEYVDFVDDKKVQHQYHNGWGMV